MQEENKTTTTATDKVEAETKPNVAPATPEAGPVLPASPIEMNVAGALIKELATPIAIVIAGIFIGAGLYFGGDGAGEPVEVANTNDPILDKALATGVDEDDFATCYQNKETLNLVQEDVDNAIATGGKGTPWSILIGPGGKKYAINGALPQQSIEQMIELAMQEANQTAADTEDQALNSVVPVTVNDHIKGNQDAKVVIVEYSDFDCPFCARYHTTMNAIVKKYPATDVAWVYRHFPLEQLHPNAKSVAIAAECVAKLEGNKGFWKFADSYLLK